MAYINTQTMQYPVSEQDIRNEYPNTSFSVPFVAPEQFAPVLNGPMPTFDAMTQGYREVAPAKDSLGNWMQVFDVYDLDQEQIAYNEEQAKQSNKQQSESLLQATDWTENASVRNTSKTPHLVNSDEFDDYRVALRGIAVNPPVTVSEWPIKPDEVWSQ